MIYFSQSSAFSVEFIFLLLDLRSCTQSSVRKFWFVGLVCAVDVILFICREDESENCCHPPPRPMKCEADLVNCFLLVYIMLTCCLILCPVAFSSVWTREWKMI